MPMRLTGFSPLVRKQIQDRADGLCERCGHWTGVSGQAHHRRPRGAGGTRNPESNQAANALWLCSSLNGGQGCHEWVESNRKEALKAGWIIPQSRNPEIVPVLRRGMWVMLLNDGDYIAIPEPATGGVA